VVDSPPDGAVVVAGEVITDLVPAGEDGVFRAAPGGSPANVAVGLARLGVPARMLARLSDDLLGRRLRRHLEGNGVDLSRAVRAAEASSLAVVALEEDGSAAYDFRVDGTADWQWTDDEVAGALDGAQALHLGSLGAVREPGGAVLRRLAAAARDEVTVSYDPNVRPLLMGTAADVLPLVHELVAVADVVKASSEDVQWLAPGSTPEEVAVDWAARGPALVVVTRGGDGAVAVSRAGGTVPRPGVEVEVADTVGAGDSFMSALLAGLHRRGLLGAGGRADLGSVAADEVGALVDEAVRASAITCSRVGADPPTAAELSVPSGG
jgi:fructokinase